MRCPNVKYSKLHCTDDNVIGFISVPQLTTVTCNYLSSACVNDTYLDMCDHVALPNYIYMFIPYDFICTLPSSTIYCISSSRLCSRSPPTGHVYLPHSWFCEPSPIPVMHLFTSSRLCIPTPLPGYVHSLPFR